MVRTHSPALFRSVQATNVENCGYLHLQVSARTSSSLNGLVVQGVFAMKILWINSSIPPSDYEFITQHVCAGLADCGHNVSIVGWRAQDQPIPWHNCICYPYSFTVDNLLFYLRQTQPDVIVMLADLKWLQTINYPTIAYFMNTAGIPWVLYYSIDADMGEKRLPPTWMAVLKAVDLPTAMTHYACEVTQANGVTPAYIPPGVDIKVFEPPDDKELAKQALGYKDKFVVLSDARNRAA